jgi:cytochrome c-type biogenesis protein
MSITQLVSSGPLLLALPVAAAAGAVTFLSPCCLPLVPGYLSFVTGMAGAGGPSSPAAPASVPAAAGLVASGWGRTDGGARLAQGECSTWRCARLP